MAVEKSYARLGLFLVVAVVVVLATAMFFLHRTRSREVIAAVTYTTRKRQRLGSFEPGSIQGRVARPRLRGPRRSRSQEHRSQLRNIPGPPRHHRHKCQADPGSRQWRHIRKTQSTNSAQPRNRRGVLVARPAGKRPATDRRSGSHRIRHTYHRCPRCSRRYRIGCLSSWNARIATLENLREIIDRVPAARPE